MKDKKRAMGRGLEAILSAEGKSVQSATDVGARALVGSILQIPIADVYPNPKQPRSFFDEKSLEELSESIASIGIIQPITVRKDGARFEIISGERRYRASIKAGLATIPAYIRIANDREMQEMALVENIQREDLDPIEVALSYQRLVQEFGLTQEEISRRAGKERATITNTLRLLKLNPNYQQALRNRQISAAHGRALLSVEDEGNREKLFRHIVVDSWNVRQAEAFAKKLKLGEASDKRTEAARELPHHLRRIEKSLADLLCVKVELKASNNGNKGKLILNYSSPEELQKIIQQLGQDL